MIRMEKKLNFEYSSGGVVYKNIEGKTFWLMTRSSPSKMYPQTYWRLPKGWLDDENGKPGPLAQGEKKANEEELRKAALREVGEETGVKAKIIKRVGTVKIFFTKEGQRFIKFVTFYLMEWQKDLPEGFGFETSEIGWFPLKKAKEKLKHKSEKETLEIASEILNSGTQTNLI